jgi:hypothetical protein
MKLLLAMLAVLVLLPQPAAAWQITAQREFRPGLQPQERRAPQRQAPQREVQPERFAPPERGERGQRRLSDEERRDLRRDVDRANRELYRQRSDR